MAKRRTSDPAEMTTDELAEFIRTSFKRGSRHKDYWRAYDLIPEFDRRVFPKTENVRFVSAAEMRAVRDAAKTADEPTRPQGGEPVVKRDAQKSLF